MNCNEVLAKDQSEFREWEATLVLMLIIEETIKKSKEWGIFSQGTYM